MLIAEGFCTTSSAGWGGRAEGFLTRALKRTLGQQLSPSLLKTEPKPAKPLWKARTLHELEEQDLRNRIYFQVRESGAGRCQRQDGTFPLPGTAMGSFPPLESPQDLSLLVLPWDIFPPWYRCRIFIPPVPLWDLSPRCFQGIFPTPDTIMGHFPCQYHHRTFPIVAPSPAALR